LNVSSAERQKQKLHPDAPVRDMGSPEQVEVGKTYFALNKGAYTTLGIANDLDVLYFCMFREMTGQKTREFGLIDVGR
jgi:hypothetical protein